MLFFVVGVLTVMLAGCSPSAERSQRRPAAQDVAHAMPLHGRVGEAASADPDARVGEGRTGRVEPGERAPDSPEGGRRAEAADEQVGGARPTFPPAEVPPPHKLTALPGDGQWVPVGPGAHGGADHESSAGVGGQSGAEGEPSNPRMVRTTLHPHPEAKFVAADVVAIDLEHTRIGWVLGTKDAEGKKLGVDFPIGVVPEPLRPRLLAVFNGGFQERHGRYGMGAEGEVAVPPRDDACSLVTTHQEEVILGSWSRLGLKPENLRFLRQMPPCLVEKGELHPWLLQGKTKVWAGQNPEIVTRRRSAVGLSLEGSVLYYVVGTETDALHLARTFEALGVDVAGELDINWGWTKFLFFGQSSDGRLEITSALSQGMVHGKTTYVRVPSDRDFFYVLSR